MAQSGYGKIILFDDFAGPELPVEVSLAYAAAGNAAPRIGPFKVTGDLAETDTGIVNVDGKANGWVRISGNNEDGKGVAIGTGTVFSPSLNGPIALETRVEMRVLTTRSIFIGFTDANADDVAEPQTATGTTMTPVASDYCGFVFDSQLTGDSANDWHAVFNGGDSTASTTSTDLDLDEVPTGGDSQVFRVEIDTNGTARWYVDGKIKKTQTGAVSTTVVQAAIVGCWGTTTSSADLDVDYIAVEANRDWTV
jgi:hypothetical protein